MKPLMLCIILCPVICCATKKKAKLKENLAVYQKSPDPGCKESQIYNLPSRQAVANMNYPKNNFK